MKIRRNLLTIPALCGAILSPLYAGPPAARNAQKADRIVILKSKRELQLWSHGALFKTYRISLGSVPTGRKERIGDHRTPEGRYVISGRNANSKFHRALRISYPNSEDRSRAAVMHVSPGGDIMIHGLPNGYGWVGRGHLERDWTDGCIAVTDREIEQIWNLVPNGTPVEIKP